jgi:hypothetical protein
MDKRKRRGARPVVFVCIALEGNMLTTKIIPANTQEEAIKSFKRQFDLEPREVLGPFFKKRAQVIESTRVLKFSNETKQAIYNDCWLVNAFMLKEPENQAYLVFIKRTDNKKVPTPKGTITVPVSELRFL